jgi:phosphatidylinositol alpha-1,6-mannosyltransferase
VKGSSEIAGQLQVLVLAPSPFATGGIERATASLLEALSAHLNSSAIGVVTLWGGEQEEPSGLPCHILSTGARSGALRRFYLLRSASFVARAVIAARRWRRSLVIVACHPYLAPVALLCSWATGAPYAAWAHGQEVWRPLGATKRLALRRARVVFAPSRFTAAQVEARAGVEHGTVRVIPHCVPPNLFDSETHLLEGLAAPGDVSNRRRVLTVARLLASEAYKGVDTLIYAWPLVTSRCPEAELVIVGDGPDRARLERVRAIVGAVNVRFLGRLSDPELRAVYEHGGIFSLPTRCRVGRSSQGEGFGLVFVEAAAHGLPVAAGRGGGVPEVVLDEVTGLLVDPDDTEDVARALLRLLLDPSLARRLGANAHRRAMQEFSFERFERQVAQLMAELEGSLRRCAESWVP